MKKLLIISVLVPLFLASCGKSEEVKTVVNPPVVEKQIVATGGFIEGNVGKIGGATTGMISGSGVEEDHGCPLTYKEETILKNKVDSLNKENKSGSFHETNIDIDFGKYGYTVLSGSTDTGASFGPYELDGEPCITGITQFYSFRKIPHRSKSEILQEITKNKFQGTDGRKLKKSLKINGLEVIVWEEFGGFPTYSQNFEVIGKYDNYFFGTDALRLGFGTEEEKEIDYEFILSVIKSLKIGNSESKIPFSDEKIKDILTKIDENTKKQQEFEANSKTKIVQGDYSAEYVAPNNYSKDTDKIIVTLSGKIHELPGVYREVERDFYNKCIKEDGRPGKLTANELVGLCASKFGGFMGFSPSGYYLLFRKGGFEYSGAKMIDVKTGKTVIDNIDFPAFYSWTNDKKRFIYGGGAEIEGESGLYSTLEGKFPETMRITDKIIDGGYLDGIYIYTRIHEINATGIIENYLKIYDLISLKEVFSKEMIQ